MKKLRAFLCLLMASVCHASEIVAWKIPLSNWNPEGLKARGVARCETSPEASPFFKEGDELWDLTKTTSDPKGNHIATLDWLVWNATSGRLIAKGNWAEICAIHKFIRSDALPRQCRLTVGVFDVPADGAALSDHATPAAELTTVVKSDLDASAFWSEAGKSIDLDVKASIADSEEAVDLKIILEARIPGQLPLRLDTEIPLDSGGSIWVARDFDGEKGLDFKLGANIELPDGSPVLERVMIGKEGKASPLCPDWKSEDPHQVGEGWAVSVRVDAGILVEALSEATAEPSSNSSKKSLTSLPDTSSVKPPEILRGWLDHEVLDAGAWVRKIIPELEQDGNFSGYDPIEQRLYFHAPNKSSAESVAGMFLSLYCRNRSTVITTLEGLGQTRLVTKLEHKARLTRVVDEKTNRRDFEINPETADAGELVKLQFSYADTPTPEHITRKDGSVTLQQGKPLELLSGNAGDGAKFSLHVKTEIFQGTR